MINKEKRLRAMYGRKREFFELLLFRESEVVQMWESFPVRN